MIYDRTIYELTSGGRDGRGVPARYFDAHKLNDALVRASELIISLDGDDAVDSAWVTLKRLPDSIHRDGDHVIGWTKTSNETPTSDGALTPDEA